MTIKLALAWPDGEVSTKVYENVEQIELFVEDPILMIRTEDGNSAYFNLRFVAWWAEYPKGKVVPL